MPENTHLDALVRRELRRHDRAMELPLQPRVRRGGELFLAPTASARTTRRRALKAARA